MSTFKVDNEQVNASVETLKKLLEECEEAYNKEIPESTQDKGRTHNELFELCKNMKTTCCYLGELINNTIRFLGESSEMFKTSDEESAAAITSSSTHQGSEGTTHGGGGMVSSSDGTTASSNEKDVFSTDQVGTVVTNVYGDDGSLRYPYSQYYVQRSSYSGRNLECVGYVKGRYEELTGVRLNINGNAIHYQYNYVNDSRVDFVTDIKTVKTPAIAVTKGYYAQYGHVILIEDITYHSDGSINQIFYTDGNSSVADGTLKVLNANELVGPFEPYGFIQAK